MIYLSEIEILYLSLKMESKETKDKLSSWRTLSHILLFLLFLCEVSYVHQSTPCTPLVQLSKWTYTKCDKCLTMGIQSNAGRTREGSHKYYFFGFLFVHTWSRFRSLHSATSGGATHKGPQNIKKLIYSMFIIYILKNVACKNWSSPLNFELFQWCS